MTQRTHSVCLSVRRSKRLKHLANMRAAKKRKKNTMLSLEDYLSSLGLLTTVPRRSGGPRGSNRTPTPAQRRAAELSSLRHLVGPCFTTSPTSSTKLPPPLRETVPAVTMAHSHVKWSPDGCIRIKPGIPADLGLVGKLLGDGKITKYMKMGKYGPELQAKALARKTPKSKRPKKSACSALDAYLKELGL